MDKNYTIPVDDAIKLKEMQCLSECYAALDIYKAICEVENQPKLAAAALYHAAYIAGIRHERAKRKR